MQYKVKPSVNFDTGAITLDEELSFNIDGMSNQYSKLVIETRDKAVREALISLGWTPPPESEKL